MGTSRASKNILMGVQKPSASTVLKVVKENNLAKNYGKLKDKPVMFEVVKRKDTNPNSMDNMQKTLDAVRKNGYKGANWIR